MAQRVARSVCFTLFENEQSRFDFQSPESSFCLWRDLGAIYCKCQVERCPTTGKPHIQGYVKFGKQASFARIRSTFPGIHAESCKGSPQQNIDYVSKSASRIAGPWQFGIPPIQGKRKDLELVRQLISDGQSLPEIINNPDVTSYQAMKGAEMLFKYKKPKVRTNQRVYWYHGSTGSGKTRAVYNFAEVSRFEVWASAEDIRWFDGYSGEKVALIDDFRPSDAKFSWLLKVLDRWPIRVPVKGTHVCYEPEHIFVTCPYSPTECYKNRSDEDLYQLNRRINIVQLFGTEVFRKDYNNSATASNFK